jgi:uncharacterized protein (TIGR03435 family)
MAMPGAGLKHRIRRMLGGVPVPRVSRPRMACTVAVCATAAAILAAGALVHAQVRTASPAFDVASVKRNQNGGSGGRLRYSPAGVDFANVPLSWIIGEAYQVAYARISSSDPHARDLFFAPTGTTYFYDVGAKADHAVSKEQIRLMLQTLLADRFKLALHHESKVQPVYKLLVGKEGPKLQESVGGGESTGGLGPGGFAFHNVEMARFSGILSGFMGRPVVDQTELTGSYDITLKIEGADKAAPDKAALADWLSSSIFTVIQKQLGLQLQADKAPVDYLVIDHVEQPSEN